MKKHIFSLILIISAFLFYGCEKPATTEWVVKVNDSEITKDQLQTGLINISSDMQKQIPKQQQTQYVLNQLVQNEILFQEAIKNQLNQNKDYQDYKNRLQNQFDYQMKLGLVELFIREKVDSTISITPEEIKSTYDNNKDRLFSEYEQRSISHIVVKTEKEANDIIKSLKKGSNFGTLAKTKSIDVQTAQQGGKIPGFFRIDGLNKEFSQPIFALQKVGKYTMPISSQAGFHIFKLDDIQTVPAKDFASVKDFISNQLYVSKRNQEITKLLAAVKDQYTLTNNPELVKKDTQKTVDANASQETKTN